MGGRAAIESIGVWAQEHLCLEKQPSYRTILRIIANPSVIEKKAVSEGDRKKAFTLTNHTVDHCTYEWVNGMWNKNIFLTDQLVQEKARLLQLRSGNRRRKYGSQYSNDWL